MLVNILAFHRVKHPNRIVVKNVIVDLQQIRFSVKANKQALVPGICVIFKIPVILNSINSPPYIHFLSSVPSSYLYVLRVIFFERDSHRERGGHKGVIKFLFVSYAWCYNIRISNLCIEILSNL